mgnify:FL=1
MVPLITCSGQMWIEIGYRRQAVLSNEVNVSYSWGKTWRTFIFVLQTSTGYMVKSSTGYTSHTHVFNVMEHNTK